LRNLVSFSAWQKPSTKNGEQNPFQSHSQATLPRRLENWLSIKDSAFQLLFGWGIRERERRLALIPSRDRATNNSPYSAKNLFSFEDATGRDAEIDRQVASASSNYERDFGTKPDFRRVEPSSDADKIHGNRDVRVFTKWFEKAQGKKIVWVESDKPIHQAFVDPENPKTIFLNANGSDPIFALVGHEWTHTLSLENPKLYSGLETRLRPLINDWINQQKRLERKGYLKSETSEEISGNIIGDAFNNPDFRKFLADRNRPLFKRIIESIKTFIKRAFGFTHKSAFGTEYYTKDLDAVYKIIDDIFYRAIDENKTSNNNVSNKLRPVIGDIGKGERFTSAHDGREVNLDDAMPNQETPSFWLISIKPMVSMM